MLTRGLGIGFIAAGLALSYNFRVTPSHRLGGHLFDFLMFFGPSIGTFGILLACKPNVHLPAGSTYARAIHYLGWVFVATPVALLGFSFLAGSSNNLSNITGMFGIVSAVLLGLPGLILLAWYYRIRSIDAREAANHGG